MHGSVVPAVHEGSVVVEGSVPLDVLVEPVDVSAVVVLGPVPALEPAVPDSVPGACMVVSVPVVAAGASTHAAKENIQSNR